MRKDKEGPDKEFLVLWNWEKLCLGDPSGSLSILKCIQDILPCFLGEGDFIPGVSSSKIFI